MDELEACVADACGNCKALASKLDPGSWQGVSGEWVARWQRDVENAAEDLDIAAHVLTRRTTSFEVLVKCLEGMKEDDYVDPHAGLKIRGVNVGLDDMRYLFLTAYQMNVWSVYDLVCGSTCRLFSLQESGEKEKRNSLVRLPDLFNAKGCLKGLSSFFAADSISPSAFRCPINFSYRIRNMLAHEGGWFETKRGALQLLVPCSQANPFGCDSEVAGELAISCGDWKESRLQKSNPPSVHIPWMSHDLRKVLKCCNDEVDFFLSRYLAWSVNTFVGHVEVFLGKKFGIAPISVPRVALNSGGA